MAYAMVMKRKHKRKRGGSVRIYNGNKRDNKDEEDKKAALTNGQE